MSVFIVNTFQGKKNSITENMGSFWSFWGEGGDKFYNLVGVGGGGLNFT